MTSASVSNGARERAIFTSLPGLRGRLPWAPLGDFPTPVVALETSAGLSGSSELSGAFIKRDDLSAPEYGGNKVRTLEVLFGAALARGATSVVATGAYGSNHAVATALHAPRVGLESAALLFPQPVSLTALDNLRVVLSRAGRITAVPHWGLLPLYMWHASRSASVSVMAPGGATPLGALGYVSAAFELGMQVSAGTLPAPTSIVVGVGSTCTSAGLLVGLALASRFEIGFKRRPPEVVAVRVTPWPVTSRFRIVRLAQRTSRLLAMLAHDPTLELGAAELASGLVVDPEFLGQGYGIPSAAGYRAIERFCELGLPPLDTTYSAKSGAGFLERCRRRGGPTLFWATKSSAVLPESEPRKLAAAPRAMRRWLARAERGARAAPASE